MARALSYAQMATADPAEWLRITIVCGCAAVLIAAGHALPF